MEIHPFGNLCQSCRIWRQWPCSPRSSSSAEIQVFAVLGQHWLAIQRVEPQRRVRDAIYQQALRDCWRATDVLAQFIADAAQILGFGAPTVGDRQSIGM